MAQKKHLISLSLTIGLFGCNYAVNSVAYKIYKQQPKVEQEHFKAAIGKIKAKQGFLEHYKHNYDRNYFIVIASSGGGYRATYTTLGVLMGLEQMQSIKNKKNMLEDVDLFSSVSGSGLGVGYYIAKKYDDKKLNLNKVVQKMLLSDTPKAPNILRTNLDEMMFNQNTKELKKSVSKLVQTKQGELKLKDIFISKNSQAQPKVPLWIVNTTVFQDMSGLALTPGELLNLGTTQTFNLKLSDALIASSAYPLAIPPTRITSKACKKTCYLYLIDGGVYDNLGILTSLKAIKNSKAKKNILIIIDASNKPETPFSQNKKPPSAIDILRHMPDMVTESQVQRLNKSLELLPENVLVIHLKASKYKGAKGVTTRFNSSISEQKKLINIGIKLVKTNLKLRKIIDEN